MEKVFLILGYGIPEDIFADLEYRSYLATAFNNIFEYAHEHKEEKIRIIFSGGKTDMVEPYQRSEAGEMKNFFDYLAKREFVKTQTRGWKIYCDTASLSTLENLLNARSIIKQKKLLAESVSIFCEVSRLRRIRQISKVVFGTKVKNTILPIDFSVSANRYLEKNYIRQKEDKAIAFDLWALKSEKNMRAYHRNFVEKFNYFRSFSPERKQEAIRLWWENGGDDVVRKSS